VNEQARKWQHKLDMDFPQGLQAAWNGKDDLSHGDPMFVYLCPRVEVTGMEGLDPVVMLPVPDFDKVVQPGSITKYEKVQTTPCKVVEVTFSGGRTMAWSDGLTPLQMKQTEEHRDAAQAHHKAHGQSAWTPPEGE